MAEITDIAGLIANIATTLALGFGAFQLFEIRRQRRIESHQSFGDTERAIWLAALAGNEIAPNIMAATWCNTPNVKPSEELFLAILMDHYEHQYYRFRSGVLVAEQWRPFESYIQHQLSTDPALRIWNSLKKYYSKSFVSHFDGLLAGAK